MEVHTYLALAYVVAPFEFAAVPQCLLLVVGFHLFGVETQRICKFVAEVQFVSTLCSFFVFSPCFQSLMQSFMLVKSNQFGGLAR